MTVDVTIVCGSRSGFARPVRDGLNRWRAAFGLTHVMVGSRRGVAEHAINWAIENEICVTVVPAEWTKHGKAAGPIRNRRMLTFDPARVLAFDGGSGTADMVRAAKAARVPVHTWNDFTKEWSLG